MYFLSLREFLVHHREDIIRKMRHLLAWETFSPYTEFMLQTEQGRHRLNIWVDMLIDSLDGEGAREVFFTYEERDGYARAIQGLKLEFSFQVHQHFQQVLWEIIRKATTQKRINLLNLWDEVKELNAVLCRGYHIIATSFLRTHEERVNEKMAHLQEVFHFTNRIITSFNFKEIVDLLLNRVTSLFGVKTWFQILHQDGKIQGIYNDCSTDEVHRIRLITNKTLKKGTIFFMGEGERIYQDIDEIGLKRVVSVPIQAHGRCYGALVLYNGQKGFRFNSKELNLLYQFTHTSAVALENAFMLEEVEKRHQELRMLTGRMITIQEEERRRLATDIHDTLAQALTGIGYKIQVCKEFAQIHPELLTSELDVLTKIVHKAIDQSRALILSLRPALIDTVGLVPALRRLIDNFVEETGVRVKVQLPKKIYVPHGISICLFRVVQEALTNVYKHSQTESAEVTVDKEDGYIILVVSDRGKGFELTQDIHWVKNESKLGLLSIKERVEAAKGSLVIDTGINRGCRIEVKIPLKEERSHHATN